jgi:hypothetical protein
MNPFRDLPHPAERLKPVKKMLLQKLMDLVVVAKLSTAFLKMLNPVQTRILNLRRNALLHSTTLHLSYKHTRTAWFTDVLLKRG